MSNKTVVFTGKNAVEVRPCDVPSPGPGEVRVRTSRTLISAGTECIALLRLFEEGTNWAEWVKYPFYPGYCGAGIVDAIDVSAKVDYKPGDRVAGWTGHQQYAVGPAARAAHVPDNVTDEEAAWLPMGVIAQHGFRKANLVVGETVIVVGLGMLGQLTVQYAHLAGAGRIIAIDPAQTRCEMAMRHGATHALACGAGEARDAVADITGGRMADVLYEITGHPAVFAAAQPLLAEFGRLILTGDCGTPSKQHLTTSVVFNNLTIIGAHQRLAAKSPTWHHAAMGEMFLAALSDGRMNVKDLISHRFAADDAPSAYELLTTRRDEAMGVIIEWPQED